MQALMNLVPSKATFLTGLVRPLKKNSDMCGSLFVRFLISSVDKKGTTFCPSLEMHFMRYYSSQELGECSWYRD